MSIKSSTNLPTLVGLSKEKLIETVQQYYKASIAESKKNKAYEDVITQLTGQPANIFIQSSEDEDSRAKCQENISTFKVGGEYRQLLSQLKEGLEEANRKIKELEQSNAFLQEELLTLQASSRTTIKELQDQLLYFQESDPIERRKATFKQLFERRKPIPIKDIEGSANNQSYLLSQFFSSEYLSSTRDDKENLIREQTEVEFNLIESSISLLKNQFDMLPTGIDRADSEAIAYDLHPLLEQLREARNRLSYLIGEKAYDRFLTEHIRDMREILDLFNSRSGSSTQAGGDGVKLELTAYEKGLIFFKENGQESYLYSYERPIDIQKRLMIGSRTSGKISPFKSLEEAPTSYLYSQLEDVARVALITSKPINNIVFVQLKDSGAPDYFSFYHLDSIAGEKRSWKLDSHLLRITRMFVDKYSRVGIQVFRQFYKDVFGHNDYIARFEEILDSKGLDRWKQLKILWENLQIISDEYMIGEIMRKVIRIQAPLYPKEDVDVLQTDKDVGDAMSDFKRVRNRWKQGLPPWEEEPEELYSNCFDKFRAWNPEHTQGKYYDRWKRFLIQEKYYDMHGGTRITGKNI